MNDLSKLDSFSSEEKSYAVKILSEFQTSGESTTLKDLYSIDFIREPASPEVFLTDPYYLGKDISSKIYPIWKELLIEILDPDSEIIELVLSGSIGCGKSSTSVIAMMYKLYYLSCLKNPQAYYGLMEHVMISFVMFSATLKLVSNTSYNDFLNMFKLSPYFNNHYNSAKSRYIELPDKNVKVMIGSNEIHEQGLNVFACFTGDTQIPLTDGSIVSIRDLVDYATFEVYSYYIDSEFQTVPGIGYNCKLIQKNARLVRIKFHDGSHVDCTFDHKFLLYSEIYKRAIDLSPSDKLLCCDHDDAYTTIVSVAILYHREDVYCFTVDKYNNFALNYGVFVHNCCLDESNYVGPKSDKDHIKAFTIYSQLRTRMESRFLFAGSQPGLVCLISSSRTESDYIDKHIDSVRHNKHVVIRSYPIWEVKNKPGMYCGETFKVDLGTKFRSPSILVDGSSDPIDGKTIDVPIEYIDSFKRDLYQSIRDIIGVSGQPLSPFLADKNLILACVDKEQVDPFSTSTVFIDIDDDSKISDYFNPNVLFNYKYGKFSPIRNPGISRVAHIDLADVNDPCGLTIGHLDSGVIVERLLPNGDKFHVESNSVRIDLMIQLRPRSGHRLDYSKIREFFLYLMNMNMSFSKITLDSYQSSDMIQYFTKLGIKSNVLSVDRTDVPYVSLKNAIIEHRIRYYHYPIFIREVSNLEHDMLKGKVDHRVGETKDVTDSVASVVHSLSASDKSSGDPIMSMVSEESAEVKLRSELSDLASDYNTGMEITNILDI